MWRDKHSITVHGLAHENIVVVPVGKDLLHSASGLGLPLLLSLCGIRGLSELGGGILVELLEVSCIKKAKVSDLRRPSRDQRASIHLMWVL